MAPFCYSVGEESPCDQAASLWSPSIRRATDALVCSPVISLKGTSNNQKTLDSGLIPIMIC